MCICYYIFKSFFTDRKLCCELLLALAVQRGSLPHLLEWIAMALKCSGPDSYLDKAFFLNVISSMKPPSLPVLEKLESTVPLHKAAMLIMQVVRLCSNIFKNE